MLLTRNLLASKTQSLMIHVWFGMIFTTPSHSEVFHAQCVAVHLLDPTIPADSLKPRCWAVYKTRRTSVVSAVCLPGPLFLASTVSALHRNAHIWNTSHPLLVTYYCRVTVYSPGMETKKLNLEVCMSFPGFESRRLSTKTHASTDWASQTVVNNGSYHVYVSMPIYLNIKSQLFTEDRKIRLTPKITNHLFTYYLNCTCKSNPVCLIQQKSDIFLLASYVQLHYFLVWVYKN